MSISNTAWAWPWWIFMVLINVVNLVICFFIFKKSFATDDESEISYRKRMRIMGVIFALVGAYRSVFVSQYDPQLAWFDTVFNSSLLIRSFAIFAELSFSGLIAYSMLKFNEYIPFEKENTVNKILAKTPYVLPGSIFLAQFFATSSVVMKSEVLWAIEETLWFIGFLAILPLALVQLRRAILIMEPELRGKMQMLRHSALVVALWDIIYVGYGVIFHLAEMWSGEFSPQETSPVSIRDAFFVVNETKEYADWGFGFLFWHSAYFSVCVWIALFLMRAPRPLEIPVEYNKKYVGFALVTMLLTLITLAILII